MGDVVIQVNAATTVCAMGFELAQAPSNPRLRVRKAVSESVSTRNQDELTSLEETVTDDQRSGGQTSLPFKANFIV